MLLETAAYNEEILVKAKGIGATRELSIINEEFGFIDRTRKHADFLAYFEVVSKTRYQKWEIVYKHFKNFCNGHCRCKDVTIGLCNDFKEYLLNLKVKQRKDAPIARNSAAGYWSTFRALLKQAHKEGWLKENLNDHLDYIEWENRRSTSSKSRRLSGLWRRLASRRCSNAPHYSQCLPVCASATSLLSNVSNGTDIYTVSKMLTHRSVKNTQIYAEVVDRKKRDATNSLSLK